MSEETKQEEKVEEKPEGDTGEGDQSKSFKAIDEANAAAERMEEANQKREELPRRKEALQVERV